MDEKQSEMCILCGLNRSTNKGIQRRRFLSECIRVTLFVFALVTLLSTFH